MWCGRTCIWLLILAAAAVGQEDIYPRNAVHCEHCHNTPSDFGAGLMTVQRIGGVGSEKVANKRNPIGKKQGCLIKP
jgi:hypothetical protein